MKTLTIQNRPRNPFLSLTRKPAFLNKFENWVNARQSVWENNRLGIAATGVFIQVTFAAVMIALLGMAGASAWTYTTGIFFAFIANSLAYAQAPMKVVLGMFILSILVNASLTVYFVMKLTGF